jgi:cobalt/nickel transport system permease protein
VTVPTAFDLSLLAVHISDGILAVPWWLGGFVGAGLLAWIATWRIREEEIPRVALLTAAFFVASLVHVRVGPTSVHLLLNGLVGVVLGPRAALAILIGVALQVALLGHGGFTTIGINSCVMALPALLSWQLFRILHRLPWLRRPWFRAVLVGACAFTWTTSLLYSVVLLFTNRITELDTLDLTRANVAAFHPLSLALAALVAGAAAWLEHGLENAPEFPLGLLVGEFAVLATALLNCLVLSWGGQEDWHALALLVFVAHLPIAVIEGIVLGFTVGFLARVKPDLLGGEYAQADWNRSAVVAVPSRNGEPSNSTRSLAAEARVPSREIPE